MPENNRHPQELKNAIEPVLFHTIFKTLRLHENLSIFTHSEALINMIGEWIDDRRIDCKMVKIVIINDTDNTEKEYTYNIYGYLDDWNYGFFSYSSSIYT